MSRFLGIRVEAATVRALRHGDRQAQDAVYRAYADAVYSLALRMLRDRGAAEDATQDTFLDVLRAGRQLAKPESLGAWIRAAAVNQCRSRLRSPWFRQRAATPGDDLSETEPPASDAADSLGMERAVDVERALGRLPPAARMVVWLHCVEGYTHREIGNVFGRTASFSKSQLARALRILAARREAQPPVKRREARTAGVADAPSTPRKGTETVPSAKRLQPVPAQVSLAGNWHR